MNVRNNWEMLFSVSAVNSKCCSIDLDTISTLLDDVKEYLSFCSSNLTNEQSCGAQMIDYYRQYNHQPQVYEPFWLISSRRHQFILYILTRHSFTFSFRYKTYTFLFKTLSIMEC